MSEHILDTAWLLQLLALPFWMTTLWFKVAMVIVAVLGGFALHRIQISKFKNKNAELQRQVAERAELLTYSVEKERKAREEAVLANRTKSLLLARINHEVRTPLNGVLGMTSLLAETPLTSEQQEYCNTIKNSGEGLLTVVNDILLNDILEYSKVESARMELEHKDFNIQTCIEDVFEVYAGPAGRAGLELLYEINPDVPVQVVGDNLRLQQILMNLVENSIKFTSAGEIIVNVGIQKALEGNALSLNFSVSDTGIGISSDKLKFLTEELEAPNSSMNTRKHLGTGLVICKKLTELMGGHVNIKSEIKRGTVTTFSIVTRPGSQSLRPVTHQEMRGLEGKNILVVEDNLIHSNLLRKQLEQWDLKPVVAHSAEQGLQLLSENQIDLILTDMQMPGMDGLELAKIARENYPQAPIVLLAAATDLKNHQHPELITSVVTKPVRRHLLAKHIRHGLKQLNKASHAEEKNTKPKLSQNFAEQHPLRILIAEDNPVNMTLTTKVLGKLGYQPDSAQNGKEVLEIVSQKNYDLILMDVQMPEMDGMEAARMIRLCLSVQPVIIAMTANTMQGDREDCLRAGMDDYISKPLNLEDLVTMLEKWAFHIKAK